MRRAGPPSADRQGMRHLRPGVVLHASSDRMRGACAEHSCRKMCISDQANTGQRILVGIPSAVDPGVRLGEGIVRDEQPVEPGSSLTRGDLEEVVAGI